MLEKQFPEDTENKTELKQIAKQYKVRGYSYVNGSKSVRRKYLIDLMLEEKHRLTRIRWLDWNVMTDHS